MGRYTRLGQIQKLDPKRDHVEIYHLMAGYEFPWDMTRPLYLADVNELRSLLWSSGPASEASILGEHRAHYLIDPKAPNVPFYKKEK